MIARSAGGSLETVKSGITGTLWQGGADELAQAVLAFDPLAIDPADCVENAERFDSEVFRRRLPELVNAAMRSAPAEREDPAREEMRRMRVAGPHRLGGLTRTLR